MANFDEYNTMINEVVTNPDLLPINAQKIIEALKIDLEQIEVLKTQTEKDKERISTLQTINQQLFLKNTTDSQAQNNENDCDSVLKGILEKYNV